NGKRQRRLAPATSMRRQSSYYLAAHAFISGQLISWQDRKGSRFHPDSRLPAVHDWIRVLPKKRRGPILLTRSPRGGAVARPASLLNQRPFKSLFLLKVVLVFSGQ